MRTRFLFLLLAIAQLSFGQPYFGNVLNFTMEDGLSHYKVLSLYPDADGMWIGTADGLNHYDGFNWQYWKHEDQQLSFRNVDFLYKDDSGRLWIFNCNGSRRKSNLLAIDLLEPGSKEAATFSAFFNGQAPFLPEMVRQFFEDDQHRLYFYAEERLWRYSPDAFFEQVQLPAGFEPIHIFGNGTFAGTRNNSLAIASPDGKILYQSDYDIQINDRFSLKGDHRNFIITQPTNRSRLFKLTADGSYSSSHFPQVNKVSWGVHVVDYNPTSRHFWMYVDPHLRLIDANGQILLQTPIWTRVACLDHSGNLWGGGAVGLYILKPQRRIFQRYLYQDSETTRIDELFRCRGMVEKNGQLYVNTYHGPQKIDLESGSYTAFGDPARKFVVLKDRRERLWFGRRLVYQLDESDGRLLHTNQSDEPEPGRIWSMLEDADGRIWIGEDGISYIEGDKIIPLDRYNGFTELKGAVVLSLFKDNKGQIWVASTRGLYILSPLRGIVARFGKSGQGRNYLPADNFQHIYQDADGIFWLATEEAGLIRWNKHTGEWKIYNKQNGFLSNNLYAVYEDDYGFLWMSSFNGLIRMEKSSGQVQVFNELDGTSNNEFNRISHFKGPDGRLFFGGQNGLTAFNPRDFLVASSEQQEFGLKVKHVSVFGKKSYRDTLSNGQAIDLADLDVGTRVIDLEIAGSDPYWNAEIELLYSLELLDEKGSNVIGMSKGNISSDNHIELFGMNPGKYNLKIKALRRTGKELGAPMVIPLNINYPLSHSLWFRLSVALAVCLLIWGFLKLRTAHLRRKKAELEHQVTERTAQIVKDQKTIRSQAEQIAEMRIELKRKDELWLEQLQTLINERLEDASLDLPTLIEDLDIGRSQFFEKVKSLTNMTPNQYIQELRLSRARDILDSGDVKTVKEVAYAVGIRRPGYFSKLFKERFGILPSEYFRRNKN